MQVLQHKDHVLSSLEHGELAPSDDADAEQRSDPEPEEALPLARAATATRPPSAVSTK